MKAEAVRRNSPGDRIHPKGRRDQKTSQRVKYSFLKILTGSDLSRRRLPFMSVESSKAGPVVWLTGWMHGDEVTGIVTIQEVFKKIQKQALLRGAVYYLGYR
jgi:predicted deacylase